MILSPDGIMMDGKPRMYRIGDVIERMDYELVPVGTSVAEIWDREGLESGHKINDHGWLFGFYDARSDLLSLPRRIIGFNDEEGDILNEFEWE